MRERNWAQVNTSNDQGAGNMAAEATSTDGSRQEMSAPDAETVGACPVNQEASVTPIRTISQSSLEWDVASSFECAQSANSPSLALTPANTRDEEETSSSENSSIEDNSSLKWNEDIAEEISDIKILLKDRFRLVATAERLQQNTFDNTAIIEEKVVSEMAKLKTELKAEIQAVVESVVQAVLSKNEADRAAILKDIRSFMEAIVKRLEEK